MLEEKEEKDDCALCRNAFVLTQLHEVQSVRRGKVCDACLLIMGGDPAQQQQQQQQDTEPDSQLLTNNNEDQAKHVQIPETQQKAQQEEEAPLQQLLQKQTHVKLEPVDSPQATPRATLRVKQKQMIPAIGLLPTQPAFSNTPVRGGFHTEQKKPPASEARETKRGKKRKANHVLKEKEGEKKEEEEEKKENENDDNDEPVAQIKTKRIQKQPQDIRKVCDALRGQPMQGPPIVALPDTTIEIRYDPHGATIKVTRSNTGHGVTSSKRRRR